MDFWCANKPLGGGRASSSIMDDDRVLIEILLDVSAVSDPSLPVCVDECVVACPSWLLTLSCRVLDHSLAFLWEEQRRRIWRMRQCVASISFVWSGRCSMYSWWGPSATKLFCLGYFSSWSAIHCLTSSSLMEGSISLASDKVYSTSAACSMFSIWSLDIVTCWFIEPLT